MGQVQPDHLGRREVNPAAVAPTPGGSQAPDGMARLAPTGRVIFAAAILGFAVDMLRFARSHAALALFHGRPRFAVVPVLPLPPAIPWLAYLLGAIMAALGAALLWPPMRARATSVAGAFFLVCALALGLPRYVLMPGNVGMRTVFLEPLTLAAFAVLLVAGSGGHRWHLPIARVGLGVTMVVYGVDHLVQVASLASLVPAWLPWHEFWIVFFGLAFIAAGVSIATRWRLRWGAAGLGLMFAVWVVTLHVPLALRWLRLPGRDNPASLWSSCFVAVAFWGGAWSLTASSDRK